MKNIQIEDLFKKLKDLFSEHFTGMLIECCIIRLNSEGHKKGVKLFPYVHTKNMIDSALELSWHTSVTDKISCGVDSSDLDGKNFSNGLLKVMEYIIPNFCKA